MAVLTDEKENICIEVVPDEGESLREERKRTGRYLAVGLVLFLIGLGLYHAVIYGSTKLSALFGAALTMFMYLLWLLYASHRRKKMLKKSEKAVERHISDVLINLNNVNRAIALIPNEDERENKKVEHLDKEPATPPPTPSPPSERSIDRQESVFNRSYSIA